MDLTDLAVDSNKIFKKCDRVRSWYMYEQLKSLEKDQQEAANRLKSKSSRVLRRGLSEKTIKRRLSDQFSSCHSGLQRNSMSQSVSTTSCSLDNFFVDFSEQEIGFYDNCIDAKESITSNDSVLRDYDMTNLKMTKKLNVQLEYKTDDIEDLELYDGEISEHESVGSCDLPIEDTRKYKLLSKYGVNTDPIMSTWSKLVTYAYHIMKLKHGANCYVDYSSQLLAAVLVVDVLRMVVGRMCDILQPLVCPISFNSDGDFSFQRKHKYGTRKNCLVEFNHKKEAELCRNEHYDYENQQNELKLCCVVGTSPCKSRCLRKAIRNLLQLSHLVADILHNITG